MEVSPPPYSFPTAGNGGGDKGWQVTVIAAGLYLVTGNSLEVASSLRDKYMSRLSRTALGQSTQGIVGI